MFYSMLNSDKNRDIISSGEAMKMMAMIYLLFVMSIFFIRVLVGYHSRYQKGKCLSIKHVAFSKILLDSTSIYSKTKRLKKGKNKMSVCDVPFLSTVHVRFTESLAKLGGEDPLMVMEKNDKRLVVGEIQLGGDLLYILIGVAKQLFCTGDEKTVDQLAHADPVCFFADARDVICRVAETLGDLFYGGTGNGVDARPFVNALRLFIIVILLSSREMREQGKKLQKQGVYQIRVDCGEIVVVKQFAKE